MYVKIDTQDQIHFPPENDNNAVNVFLNREWCFAHGYDKDWTQQQIDEWIAAHPTPVVMKDYDNALEAHLKNELTARGYTTRSPIEYTNSKNMRWAQDAKDWQAHLDAVMEYGLEIMNRYAAGEEIPALADFKAALPVIEWSEEVTE